MEMHLQMMSLHSLLKKDVYVLRNDNALPAYLNISCACIAGTNIRERNQS